MRKTHPEAFFCLLAAVVIPRGFVLGDDDLMTASIRHVIELPAAGQPSIPVVVTAVSLGPSGRVMATAGDDHLVRLWSTAQGKQLRVLGGHLDWIRALAFQPDGQVLASAGDDGRIRRWQLKTGRALVDLPHDAAAIYALQYSPDGKILAAAGFDGKMWLYDGRGATLIRSMSCPCQDTRTLAFSADSTRLAAAGRNGRIRVWETKTGDVRFEVTGERRRVRALAFSPDDTLLASAGDAGRIRIRNADDGSELYWLDCRAKVMSLVFFGQDRLVTGGSDNLLRVWNLTTRSEELRLPGHTGSVSALTCNPAADTLVSSGFDATVRVWDVRRAAVRTETVLGNAGGGS